MRDGRRVFAERTGERASCPDCGDQLIAKVGTIVEPHWAHPSQSTCSGGGGPEGEFHRRWKMLIGGCDPERIEVRFSRHRADAIDIAGRIVEVQCSAISADDIGSREATYGERLIWLAPDTRLAGRVRAPLVVVDEVSGRARCRDRVMSVSDLEAAIPAYGVSFLTIGPLLGLVRSTAPAPAAVAEPPLSWAHGPYVHPPMRRVGGNGPPKRWTSGVVELVDDCDVGGVVVPVGTKLWGYPNGIVWHGGYIACRVRPVVDAPG